MFLVQIQSDQWEGREEGMQNCWGWLIHWQKPTTDGLWDGHILSSSSSSTDFGRNWNSKADHRRLPPPPFIYPLRFRGQSIHSSIILMATIKITGGWLDGWLTDRLDDQPVGCIFDCIWRPRWWQRRRWWSTDADWCSMGPSISSNPILPKRRSVHFVFFYLGQL